MVKSKWTPISEQSFSAVAIANFDSNDIPYSLCLLVGDKVCVQREFDDWYLGHIDSDSRRSGIFPKNHVHIKPCLGRDKSLKNGGFDYKGLDMAQEISETLREWSSSWKQLYLQRSKEFETIRNRMYELIDLRQTVMSNTLTVDELRTIKQTILSKINVGNSILGLDMVVWDENPLPQETSAINLYHVHETISRQVKKGMAGLNTVPEVKVTDEMTDHSLHFSLYVTVNNCTCNIGEDADILVTLYDANENYFISENYVVQWSSQGLMKEFAKLSKARVIFSELGAKDIAREKVFIVCQIIRRGAMELKENESNHKNHSLHTMRRDVSSKQNEIIRRPFGVAAIDITDVLKVKASTDDEKQFFVPFMQCLEKDSLDSIMRKVVSVRGGEISEKEHKGQGLWISYRLLVGDLDQARCDYPQLVSPFTQIARRMGFPEIILPDDVRNDLYVTLVSGEFSHKAYAKNAKNIEATVKCFDSSGNLHSSALTIGPGLPPGPEYKSVVYYHEEKPKWMETFKICLDFDELPCAHLKISFKHRSSNESKDRNEKPFAFCFIRLQNENETTLQDGIHELNVYKIDRKKYDESETNIQYLHSLPATRKELEAKNSRSSHSSSKSSLLSNNNVNVPGLSLIPADVCTISSLLCSTKLTQNIDLLGLLRYKTDCADDSDLKSCLLAFMKVDGAEIVQFLTDILDSLFNILQSRDSEEFMDLVFQSLVFIVSLLSDAKYQQFRKTLDRYIQRTFSFSSAYIKLIFVLKRYVDNLSSGRISSNFSFSSTYSDLRHSSLGIQDQEWIPNFMKSLEYLFKFIVKSRWLFLTLNNTSNKSGMNFHDSMQHLLVSFTNLMSDRSKASLEVQQMCLQYFPTALSDIILVFDKEILSEILTALLNNVPFEKLKKEKLLFMLDVIQCDDLFSDRQARTIILPVFNEYLRHFLEKHIETSSCVKVLSEILLALHQRPPQDIVNDVNDLMKSILTTVIFSVIKRKKDDVITKNLVAILIDILRLMTSAHYKGYIESFEERHDLLNFLIQVFMLFKDLVNSPIFPKDWAEMLFLQNQVILSSIKEFAEEIRNRFCEDNFVYQLWNNFFHCAISFLLQESLQSEDFSFYKRNRMTKKYGDMRRELASVIRKMWFHLSKHAKDFVPHMIGPFLEMALIPDRTLREEIIPIFFEMMQCEFYTEIEEKRPGNFNRCKEEMISQLDKLFEAHRGDEDFRQLFKEEMLKKFEGHSHMKDKVEFVGILSTLMKRLLEHRAVSSDELENVECQMICLFNLLEFFRQNDCGKLYLRYLYKLLDLNITNGFHAEAAHTLYLHAKCLEWSDNPVPPHYRTEKYPNCKTQRELKETLVRSMIDHFEKGQQREEAIVICQELIVIHERDILNYEMLAELYQKMSTLYADIVKQPQFKREYYRVGYYGQGFPAFLRNRAFIHRGKDYERLSDFTKRLTDYFPQAKRLDQTSVVRKEIMDSSDQYLQINSVDPSIKLPEKFQGKLLPPYTLLFYENNRVHEFSCSRIFKRESQNSDCEISTIWVERITMKTKHPLPHISPCLQVIETKSKELSPIEIAIEDLEKKLDELIRELSCYHFNLPNQNISSLLQKIQGVVDAPVNGGIEQYEKAFLSPDFMACRDPYLTLSQREGFTRHLKHLILSLIPLIDIAFNLIKPGIQPSFQPLCEHLINSYRKMKLSTERKYKKTDFSLSPKLRQAIEEFSQKGLTTSPDPEKLDRSSFTRSVGKGRLRSGFGHKSGIWNSSVSTPSLNPISNTFNSVRNIRKNGFSKIGQANKEGTKWFDGDRASSISAKDSEEDLFRPARSFRPRSSGPISCPNGDLYLSSTNLRSPNSRHSDEPDMALSLPTSPPSLPPKRSSNDLSLRRNENITQYHTYVRPRKNSLPTQKRPLPPYPQRPLDKSPTEQSHEQ